MGPSARNQAQDASLSGGITHRVLSGGDPRVPAISAHPSGFDCNGQRHGRAGLTRVHVPGRRTPCLAEEEDLFELRAILEAGAIRLTVARATTQALSALDAFRGAGEGVLSDFSRDDAHFHLTIAELSGNRRLATEAARLIDMCDRVSVAVSAAVYGAGWANALRADHAALIGALQARDAARAIRLSARHLARTRAALAAGSGAAKGGQPSAKD
jgi:hypothetical protein